MRPNLDLYFVLKQDFLEIKSHLNGRFGLGSSDAKCVMVRFDMVL
jgi:hypothetical protein